jgi:hypothetical protein
MARRNTTLLQKVRALLASAHSLCLQPRTDGLKRFQPGDVAEGEVMGGDALILHATPTRLDVRYVVRDPASGGVWGAWAMPFSPRMSAAELYDWLDSLRRASRPTCPSR